MTVSMSKERKYLNVELYRWQDRHRPLRMKVTISYVKKKKIKGQLKVSLLYKKCFVDY